MEQAPTFPALAVAACCSAVYGHPFTTLIVGESLHPGGLAGTRELLDAVRASSGARLLDLGCGLGASARLARDEFGLDVTAMELSRNILRQAREREPSDGIAWVRTDAESLPFEDDAFDVVLAECVLSSIPQTRAFDEIRRVLAAGGSLAVSDVRRTGDAIAALEDHPLLGTALCATTAWVPGEFDERVTASDLRIIRTWDRDAAVGALLDRIEGRLTIARDLLAGAAAATVPADAFAGVDSASIRRLLRSARDAVDDGRLGYFAAICRAPV